jgi:hypothetical protein
MLRIIIFLLLLVLSGHMNAQKAQQQNNNSGKPEIDIRHLRGPWWDASNKDSRHPLFQIDSTVIRYTDEHEDDPGHRHDPNELTFKYQIQEGNLIIYYGRFADTAKIISLTKETMQLMRGGDTVSFFKPKN